MIITINDMYGNGTNNLKAPLSPSNEMSIHRSDDEMMSCSEECKEYAHAN
jgi:hypothetical protein